MCGKLGSLLSKLAGPAGYRSLLTRAVALAQAETPSLKTLHVLTDGAIIGFYEVQAGSDPEQFQRNEVVLVSQLLALLTTFIGETLTLQLVKEVWPAIDTQASTDSPTP